jgi:hypothetical protein
LRLPAGLRQPRARHTGGAEEALELLELELLELELLPELELELLELLPELGLALLLELELLLELLKGLSVAVFLLFLACSAPLPSLSWIPLSIPAGLLHTVAG